MATMHAPICLDAFASPKQQDKMRIPRMIDEAMACRCTPKAEAILEEVVPDLKDDSFYLLQILNASRPCSRAFALAAAKLAEYYPVK